MKINSSLHSEYSFSLPTACFTTKIIPQNQARGPKSFPPGVSQIFAIDFCKDGITFQVQKPVTAKGEKKRVFSTQALLFYFGAPWETGAIRSLLLYTGRAHLAMHVSLCTLENLCT